jgi:hypothetical protein
MSPSISSLSHFSACPDVIDGEVLAPEERDIGKLRALIQDILPDGLALAFGTCTPAGSKG